MSARFLLALLLLAGENAISLTAELKVVNDPATRTVLSNVDVAATNSHGSTYHKRSAYPSAADAQPVPMFVEHEGSAFSPVQSLIQPQVAASSQVVASSPVVASNPVVTAGASYQPRQPLTAIHDGTGAYGGGGPLASSIGAVASSSSYQSHQPYSDPTLLQQPVNPISSGYGNTPSLIQNPGIISSGYQAHQPVVGDVLNRDQYLTLESRYKHALRPETAGYLDRSSYNRPADLLVASQDPLGYGSSSRHDVAVSLVPGGAYGNQQQLARPDLTNRILSQRSANYGGSYEQLQRLLGRYIARRDYSGARTPVVDSLGGNSFLDQTRSTFGPGFINGVGGGGGFPLGQFRNQGNFVLGQGGLRI